MKLVALDEAEDFEGFDCWDIRLFNDVAYKQKRQRLYAKSALHSLPTSLKQYLYLRPLVYLPNRCDSRVMNSFTISPEGVGTEPQPRKGYSYRKFETKEEMLAVAQTVGEKHDDKEGYLWLGAGVPYFVVPLGWARQNLSELGHRDLGIVSKDLKVGLVLTDELGICQRVPRPDNPSAIQWVLGVWGYYGN